AAADPRELARRPRLPGQALPGTLGGAGAPRGQVGGRRRRRELHPGAGRRGAHEGGAGAAPARQRDWPAAPLTTPHTPTGDPVPAKSTKAEVRKRVEAVSELRRGGAGFADVRAFARMPEAADGTRGEPWGVSDGHLRRYIRAADRLCARRAEVLGRQRLAIH